MEARCGSCNKLFRVPDEKITGKGVKFACTRCGEAIKITQEDFEHYALSKTAVSALDMFEPKPKPAKAAQAEPVAAPKAAQAPSGAAPVVAEESPFAADSQGFDLSESSGHETASHDLSLEPSEPDPFAEQTSFAHAEHLSEPQPAVAEPFAMAPEASTPSPSTAPKPELKPKPERVVETKPVEERSAQKLEPRIVPEPHKPEAPAPAPKPIARPAAMAVPKPQPAVQTVPKNESARPPAPPAERVFSEVPASPARSGSMVPLLIAGFVVLALAAYGVFFYLQSDSHRGQSATPEMASIEGLTLTNAAASMEPSGDLLITGVIENASDKERHAWYVVIDVLDALDNKLARVRLVNGKQIYSKRDYDILAKQGKNIQELKTRSLQPQGVVIPAKGSVSFEVRCLEPPAGIANIKPIIQPFDPVRLFKEIAEEAK